MATKKELERIERLMPNGIPRYVRIFDNGGTKYETCDRYTSHFTRVDKCGLRGYIVGRSMSSNPFHPQGVGIWFEDHFSKYPSECFAGYSLRVPSWGRQIKFQDLPADCQRSVIQDYCDLWKLPLPADLPKPSFAAAG